MLRQNITDVAPGRHRPPVDGGNDIPHLGALAAHIAFLGDGHDPQPHGDAVIGGLAAAYLHHGDAHLRPAGHTAMLHQVIQDGQRRIDGNGEPDALVALLHQLAGGDPHHLPVGIDERAAAVAGVDGRIGLNTNHGIAQLGGDGALHRRNISYRLGGSQRQPAGVADGHHHFAYLQLIAVAEGRRDQSLLRQGNHPQQRQIALVIGAHQLGVIAVAVLQHHLVIVKAAYHVGVGDDIPVFRKDDAAALCGGAVAVADDAHHRGGAFFIDARRGQKAVPGGFRYAVLRLILLVYFGQMLQLAVFPGQGGAGRVGGGGFAVPCRHADAQRPGQHNDHAHGNEKILQSGVSFAGGGVLPVVPPVVLIVPLIVAVIAAVFHAVSPPGRQRVLPAMW